MKQSSNQTIRYFLISLCLSFILILGFYQLFFHVSPIFALNDSSKAWAINNTTSSDYTSFGGVSFGASGATIENKFSNPGFESGTTGWTPFSQASANIIGNGADGAITVSTSKTIDTTAIATGRTFADAVNFAITSSVSSGATSVVLSGDQTNVGLLANDEVLLINLQGTSGNYANVGQYETVRISSLSYNAVQGETTVNFSTALTNAYDGTTQKIMLQRVPNYTNVTIQSGGTITVTAWNGTKYGVLFFRASGTVDVQSGGSINAFKKGYRGGACKPTTYATDQGESIAGVGATATSANIGGGGGVVASGGDGAGGAGGGYGTGGINGTSSATGGLTYGTTSNSSLYLGSGGGGGRGNTSSSYCSGHATNNAGFGGGIVFVSASTVTVTSTGAISAKGENYISMSWPGNYGAGGAGSGGSLVIKSNNATLGSTLVTAAGGSGGSGYGANGKAGGHGRITIDAFNTGTATPSAYGPSFTQTDTLAYKDTYSMKIIAPASDTAYLTQSINIGDTNSYQLSAYVYDGTAGNIGGTVSDSIAQLYYNGSVITTTYTDAGSGWWRLDGTLTGANASRVYGLAISAGKTIYIDSVIFPSRTVLYPTTTYTDTLVNTWDSFCEGTLSGSDCTTTSTKPTGTAIYYQICVDDVATCNSSGTWQYYTVGAWTTATNITSHRNTAAQLTQAAMQALSTTNHKIAFKAILETVNEDEPLLPNVTIGYTTDTTTPPTNATSPTMKRTTSGASVSSNGWTNDLAPYFSWTAGADNAGGSGIKGYCLYLGTSSTGNPSSDKGFLGTSPVSTTGSACQFIVSTALIDFVTTSYRGGTWLTTSSSPYYLNIKAVDNSGNVYDGTSTQFQFRFDNTSPSNPSFISTPADYISTESATILWSSSGSDGPADSNSGVAGLQYRIGDSGTWYGDNHTGTEDNTDLLTNDGSYTTDVTYDFPVLVEGNNLIYFRTWDSAGNASSTYVSGSIKINTTAPSAPQSLAVTPSDATTNSYAFSWSAPSTYTGQSSGITYCYTVNTLPSASTCTFTSAGATSLSADAFATQPGTNTFYLVAKDEAGNINYDVYTSVTFTYSGTAPGIPTNVDIADISIKASSSWKLAISWTAPTNVGAGVSSYKIYRSTTATSCSSSFSSFSYIGATAGTSYTDTSLSQTTYYYCIKACDSANSCSAVSDTVSKYPDGKYTSSAGLTSGPTVSSITTKKATITWSTDRTSDSKIQYGTSTGSYFTEEVSNSSQVTSHSITLTNLSAGTTYYYKTKWTDEDGNTGISSEKTFTTDPAPVIMKVSNTYIGIDSTIIQFTARGASKVKIYYGPTTAFGGLKEIATSTTETVYTVQLTGLSDDTEYFFKINTFDTESQEYENQINNFTTLPMPKISLATLHEAKGAATPTVLVTWDTNTAVSSIVTYYPKSDPGKTRDEIDVNLKSGAHTMFVRNLIPNSDYLFIISGRDKIGTEAKSEQISFTTSTDTRSPQISSLTIESGNTPPVGRAGEVTIAQLIVAWNTDEPSTSQVEYGEGTGTTYNQKTQEDQSLTFNHLVVISGLTPSKVYHLRALSKDKAANLGNSIDTVTITPKAVDNALDLVISNLREAFGFLK